MTADDVVKYYFQEFDEEDIEHVLFNYTAYPFGCLEWIAEEVYEYYIKNRN